MGAFCFAFLFKLCTWRMPPLSPRRLATLFPSASPFPLSLSVSLSVVSVCRSPSCLSSLSLSLLPTLLLSLSPPLPSTSVSCLLYFEPQGHSKRNKASGRPSFKANLFPVSKRKKSLSLLQSPCVQFFVTLWTIALQVRLSMEFSRQESGSGLPFPSPGDLPNPGIKPASPALADKFFTPEPPGKPVIVSLHP